MRGCVNGIALVLTLLYPPAVYYGISYLEPRQIAVAMAGLIVVKWLTGQAHDKVSFVLTLMLVLYCGFNVFNNSLITLRFYPVLVNLGLLAVFSYSLYYPPSIIERLARFKQHDLPERGVVYTRRVTRIWCLFFLGNGLVAAYTAVWCSMAVWSLYNGFIAYGLIALLMAVEYLVRRRTQDYVR